jgi:F-type H+-transporting ATPase subunit delta
MKVSKVAKTAANRIFRMCMASGSLNETHMRSAIAKLVEAKPRDYQGILVTLKRLVRLEMERKHAIVESAAPLDLEERSRAADSIIAQYGKDLTFEYKVTPELLGGLRIQVGNDVLDGSVKGRLDRLANAF